MELSPYEGGPFSQPLARRFPVDAGERPETMLDQSNTSVQSDAADAADAPIVTDWQDVFEHTDHGLIPLVLQARSIEALK